MWFKATLFTILIVTSTGNHCSVWFTCRVQSFGVAKKLDITLYGTVALNCHLVVKYVCPLQLHFYWALPIHCISDIWYRVLSSKKKPYRQKNNKNHISHQFYYTVLRIYGARFCPPHLNHIGGKTGKNNISDQFYYLGHIWDHLKAANITEKTLYPRPI